MFHTGHWQLVKSTDILFIVAQRRKNLLSAVLTVIHIFRTFRYRKILLSNKLRISTEP